MVHVKEVLSTEIGYFVIFALNNFVYFAITANSDHSSVVTSVIFALSGHTLHVKWECCCNVYCSIL